MPLTKITCGNYTTNLLKDNVNDLIDNVTLYNGIKALPQIEGTVLNVKGFYADTSVGGGQFYYDPLKDKSEHNGGTIIAPEALAVWNGTQADVATLLDWSGTGTGCFVRLLDSSVKSQYFNYSNAEDLRLKLNDSNENDETIYFGRTSGVNSKLANEGVFDFANFAGQTNYGSEPIGFVAHHYTDGNMMQLDNVGESNKILVLKNAHNSNRRSDKATDFVGSGVYISFDEHDYSAGFNRTKLFVDSDANFTWTGVAGTAKFRQNKDDDGLTGFRIDCIKQHVNMFDIVNGANSVVIFTNDVSFTRASIYSHVSQTNGLFLESKSGSVRLKSANNTVLIDGTIRANSGDTTIGASGGVVNISALLKLPQYSTSGLPSAATSSGCVASISDSAGKPSPIVYSNGTNWLYMDNTTV